MVSPSGAQDDCFIQSIDQDMYSVRFMPRDNGVHNIHVKFNGVHIPGSPYRLKVGKGDADPAAVHATGSGLGDVKTGKLCPGVSKCYSNDGRLSIKRMQCIMTELINLSIARVVIVRNTYISLCAKYVNTYILYRIDEYVKSYT